MNYADISSSDAIVVLSGGRHLPPGNTEIIEWEDPDRFISGINLYRANKLNKLIFTGGLDPLSSTLPPEGDIYIKEAISMGIPKKDLFTTYPVFNTLGEAKERVIEIAFELAKDPVKPTVISHIDPLDLIAREEKLLRQKERLKIYHWKLVRFLIKKN